MAWMGCNGPRARSRRLPPECEDRAFSLPRSARRSKEAAGVVHGVRVKTAKGQNSVTTVAPRWRCTAHRVRWRIVRAPDSAASAVPRSSRSLQPLTGRLAQVSKGRGKEPEEAANDQPQTPECVR